MEISLVLEDSSIDYVQARTFLNLIGFKPETTQEQLAWQILDPLSPKQNFVSAFTTNKNALAVLVARVSQEITQLNIHNAIQMDEGSAEFFGLLEDEIHVRYLGESDQVENFNDLRLEEVLVQEILDQEALPCTPQMAVKLAERYNNAGNYRTAAKILQQVQLAATPYFNLAKMYRKMGLFDRAFEMLTSLMTTNPYNINYRLEYSRLNMGLQRCAG